jgi:hypothetical protein
VKSRICQQDFYKAGGRRIAVKYRFYLAPEQYSDSTPEHYQQQQYIQ